VKKQLSTWVQDSCKGWNILYTGTFPTHSKVFLNATLYVQCLNSDVQFSWYDQWKMHT
jgi:hypothetical protein